MKKKNLAVIGVGIVGTGRHREGIPAFAEALLALSEEYNVTIYSFIPVDKANVPAGLRIRCAPSQNMSMRLRYIYLATLFFFDHLRTRFQLIHAQSPIPAGVMAHYMQRIFGVRWLLSFHATEATYMPDRSFGDLMNAKIFKRSRQITHNADLVMTFSSPQAADIRKHFDYNGSIVVLPRGIHVPKELEPKTIASPLRLLHISYYQFVKDHETLLKAFARISREIDCTLTIIGENYGEEFQNQIKQFAPTGKIEMVGAVPRKKILEVFKEMHVLLHSSIYEGLPMVALEAMANGVVVCGTHVGLMADFSGDRCITVPVGDHEKLAGAVLNLVRDPQQYETVRAHAHRWLVTHDMHWYLHQLRHHYENVIHGHAN